MSEIIEHMSEALKKKGQSQSKKKPIPLRREGKSGSGSEPQNPELPQDLDDAECMAILVARSAIGDEDDMKNDAQDSLMKALENDDFYVEGHDRNLYVANHPGLAYGRLPARVEDLVREVEARDKTVIENHKLITRQEQHILFLEARLRDLTQSLDFYHRSRGRFISVFKRDEFGIKTQLDHEIIHEGNETVHGGDAITDAILYTRVGGRADFFAYKALYGYLPETVLRLRLPETISLLNAHAGVRASKFHKGSEKFYHLFAEFVRLLQDTGNGFDESYLEHQNSPVFNAYWEFMEATKGEVRAVVIGE